MIFFGVLSGLGWYAFASGAHSAEVTGSTIGSTDVLKALLSSRTDLAHWQRLIKVTPFAFGEKTTSMPSVSSSCVIFLSSLRYL